MNLDELKELAPGSILILANDGKAHAGKGAQFRTISDKGNAGLLIAGRLVWVSPERLAKNG